MENQIKVGQSCEVAVITDNSAYPSLYSNGNTGVLKLEFMSGAADMYVGRTRAAQGSWHVLKNTYKKIGKLTITKVKQL